MNDYLETRELYHWGIKGQKWGVRRYQNEDGTLTSAGKARYNSDGSRKKSKEMTDQELRESINRLQSEQQYDNLTGKNNFEKGFVSDTAIKAAIAFVGAAGLSLVKSSMVDQVPVGKRAVKKALGNGIIGATTITALSFGLQIKGAGG